MSPHALPRCSTSCNHESSLALTGTRMSHDPLDLSRAGLSVIQNRFGCSTSDAQALLVLYAVRVERALLEITCGLIDEHLRGGILEEMRDM